MSSASDLFVRSTRQVELTEAGRALLGPAHRAVDAAEDGRDAVAAVRGLVRGRLAIGAIQTVSPLDLPGAAGAPAPQASGRSRCVVRLAGVASLVRETADGELELAIVDLPLGPAGRSCPRAARSAPSRCSSRSPPTIRWRTAAGSG